MKTIYGVYLKTTIAGKVFINTATETYVAWQTLLKNVRYDLTI